MRKWIARIGALVAATGALVVLDLPEPIAKHVDRAG